MSVYCAYLALNSEGEYTELVKTMLTDLMHRRMDVTTEDMLLLLEFHVMSQLVPDDYYSEFIHHAEKFFAKHMVSIDADRIAYLLKLFCVQW